MKKRKMIALLLSCSMIMAMVGCGNEEVKESGVEVSNVEKESSAEIESESVEEDNGITFPLEEPIEIDVVACPGNEPLLLENTWIMQWMEEQTNVKLNITHILGSELVEKRNILINSGDYPDVFLKAGLNGGIDYELGKEEIVIDLTDLIKEYAPNYSAILDAENAWNATKAPDGKIYSTVEFRDNSIKGPAMSINKTWLDNLGLEVPTSTEEFYEVLKAFRDEDANGNGDPNDEIPLMFASADIIPVENIWNYFGIDHKDWCDYFQMTDDGEIRYFPATEEYKEITEYLTMLYDEKLINQDTFTLTAEQQKSLAKSGTPIGAFFDWATESTVGTYVEGENELALEYVEVYPFEQNGGKFGNGKGVITGAFAITDKCEYPEIMVAWMDLLYSYEGSMISQYGFEGEQYEIVDGKVKGLPEWDGKDIKPYKFTLAGVVGTPLDPINTAKSYIDPEKSIKSYQRQEFLEGLAEKDMFNDVWPTLSFTDEETEVNATVLADANAYFKNYRAQVISGEIELEATWDEYIKTLENMGIRDVEANYNAALERANQ